MRRGGGRRRRPKTEKTAPLPVAAVDLLAGLAPGVELEADDLPPGIDPDLTDAPTRASMTVAEAGRLIRSGEGTVRRLIRTPLLEPGEGKSPRDDVDRAGVPPRTPDKPGE